MLTLSAASEQKRPARLNTLSTGRRLAPERLLCDASAANQRRQQTPTSGRSLVGMWHRSALRSPQTSSSAWNTALSQLSNSRSLSR